MPTSPTDAGALLVFADAAGRPGRSLRVDSAAAATILAVPGDQVALHWIDLAPGLTPAQAAAAARLILADASAEPISAMHVAIGPAENGLTPAAIVPAQRMSTWLAEAEAAGLDPDLVMPTPLLLAPPATGFVGRDLGEVGDYRGTAAAFTLEPDLAEALIGDAAVEPIDEARFEAQLGDVLAAPAINLRQGQFARRRQWKVEGGRLRRAAILAIALAVLTLAVQVVTIFSYTFAADRLEAEAASLAVPAANADTRLGFGTAAAALFEAVRATPNAELARLEYRPDGSLNATVMMDGPETLAALRARLEASGLAVEAGELRSAGGRPTTDLTVRAG